MSGISEIKKRAKLSIDEMYDNQIQSVGDLDNQKESKPERKQASQLENRPNLHPAGSPSFQEVGQTLNNRAGRTIIQQNGEVEANPDAKREPQITRTTTTFPTAKQQTQKIPTYKMTFNLTEDIYKAFNDLYAKRMLQGRKTEKSEMICEAIQWLIKMEEEQIQ